MNGKAMNMANELEVQQAQQLSAQRSLNDLTNQLTIADHLVYKKYLAELRHGGAFSADVGGAESCPVHPNVPAEGTDPEKGRRYVPETFHGVLF